MTRPASVTVNWNITFSNAGIFSLDVNVSGHRQDNDQYIETHGFATVNVTWHDISPPSISDPLQQPDKYHVGPDDNVTIAVNVTDLETGVRGVTLSYTAGNSDTWQNVTMAWTPMTASYEGIIPKQAFGTQMRYKIIACDNVNNTAVNDHAGNYFVYDVIPEFVSNHCLLVALLVLVTTATLLTKKAKLTRRLA